VGIRTVLSDSIRRAAKLDARPLYRLALEAGIPPASAYRAIRGIVGVRRGDSRYLHLGAILGIPPSEIFKTESYGTDREESET
jgi:hypothetical protein